MAMVKAPRRQPRQTFLALTMAALMAMPSAAAMAAEKLLVPKLPGWTVVSSVSDANGESSEMVPDREVKGRWSRRMAVQAFRSSPLEVKDFLEQVVQQTQPVCESTSAGPISMGKVGNAPAGSRAVTCGRYKGDGLGTYALYFAIRGHNALYVVSRLWRGDPFQPSSQAPIPAEEVQDWTNHFNSIDLCGYDSSNPCR